MSENQQTMSTVEIETQISFEELLNLNFTMSYRRPLTTIVTALAFILLVYALFAWDPNRGTPLTRQFYIYFSIAYLIGIPIVIYARVKRYYSQSRNISEPCTYRFTQGSIEWEGFDSSGKFTWNNVRKIHKVGKFIVLTQDAIQMYVIRKEAFSPSQFEQFKEFVKVNRVHNSLGR